MFCYHLVVISIHLQFAKCNIYRIHNLVKTMNGINVIYRIFVNNMISFSVSNYFQCFNLIFYFNFSDE